MAIPGFTADVTLYRSIRPYAIAMAPWSVDNPSVLPAQIPTRCVGLLQCCPPARELGGICYSGQCCPPDKPCCTDSGGGGSCCDNNNCTCYQGSYGCLCGGSDGGYYADGGTTDGDDIGDGGDGGDGGCFVAGTLVSTDSNGSMSIPINEIEVGTEVLAYDIEKREAKRRKVIRVYRAESDSLLVLDFGVEQVRCTPRHRFFNGTWTAARDLQFGDKVLCRGGNWQKLLSVTAESSHEPVFNLRVANQPNYFVGSLGFLVHNTKDIGDDQGLGGDDLFFSRLPRRS